MQTHKNILKYSFISLFIIFCLNTQGQPDSLRKTGGLTLGMDVSRFIVQFWHPVKSNFEFSVSSDVYRNIYINGEAGWMKTEFTDEDQNYSSGGFYLRFGGVYNLFKKNPEENDLIYLGALFGHSNYWHQADQITISDSYWGTGTGQLSRKTLKGNWLEIKVGIQIELFKNWFLGWAIRPRFYLFGTQDERMPPYIIPGFGKGENTVNLGLSYSVAYRIPYRRSKMK